MTAEEIRGKLEEVSYPGFKRSIVSFGVIKDIQVADDMVTVNLQFSTTKEEVKTEIKTAVVTKLKEAYPDIQIYVKEATADSSKTKVNTKADTDPWAGRAPIPGIKNIIAVASGKGGVGKSTVATNLAMALSQKGLKVGLMDSDIYGPSVHIMLGAKTQPFIDENEKIIPVEKFGIKIISMGMLLDEMSPVIWRGPMVMKVVEQFLNDVIWGELDVLVIDLPPGTGDAQLTLVQKVPVDGAIIVTTPQEVALVDARRGLKMFEKVKTPVWGIIENMSYFIAPDTGNKYNIFGENGGLNTAKQLEVELLGQVPIEPIVVESGDQGVPVVEKHPEAETSKVFIKLAETIMKKLK